MPPLADLAATYSSTSPPQLGGRTTQRHSAFVPASQLLVERYFLTTGVLSSFYYWIGAKRVAASPAVFYNSSNAEVPEAYSTEPYAHWASYHYQQASVPGYECVLAVGSYAYDTFSGNPESKAHLSDPKHYQRTPDSKYGCVDHLCLGRTLIWHCCCAVALSSCASAAAAYPKEPEEMHMQLGHPGIICWAAAGLPPSAPASTTASVRRR